MDKTAIKDALQELIIRLKDAERGYMEIYNAADNIVLKRWMEKYAAERKSMNHTLQQQLTHYKEAPKVKTSILGDLHRMFIDLKLNNTEEDYDSIINEIKRGSEVLIDDYENVIKNVEMEPHLKQILKDQLHLIRLELNSVKQLQEELNAVEA